MRTTIDTAGRLVIPRDIRQQAGLRPGSPIEVRWTDGRIEIEPVSLPVDLVQKGRFLIAVPQGESTTLTTDTVERTREAVATEHGTVH